MIKKKGKLKPIPVWHRGEKGRCVVDTPIVVDFLNYMEFGIFKQEIIKRDSNKVLREYNQEEISSFLFDYYMNFDESEFENPNTLGVIKSKIPVHDVDGNLIGEDIEYYTKSEVRSALMKFGWYKDTLRIYLNKFDEDKSKIKEDFLHTPIFKDTKDSVYTFFKNGIIRTTKMGSELVPYKDIKNGFIWESSIRPKVDKIKVDDNSKGLFEKFVELSMSVKNDKGEWELNEEEYHSFRGVYGYMLSNYNNGGLTPAPFFVDRDSDGKHANGGNGKSLVMGSVEHWKKTLPINGKNIQRKNEFTFSGVNSDTEFIFLDDVDINFDFKTIYNYTTSDMEIRKMYRDRFIIDKHSKPKIGVSTNYVLDDTEGSTTRRQYIVEFGSYWHDKLQYEGISPVDYFNGKRLFDDFNQKDWIEFYNFGFRCINQYLREGVKPNPNSTYRRKQIISQIEGIGVNDGVVDWMTNWVKENELNLREGIPINDFYLEFDEFFEDDVKVKWENHRLKKGLYKLCDSKEGWIYNPHKVGNNPTQKRWLKGERGKQTEWIKIHLS